MWFQDFVSIFFQATQFNVETDLKVTTISHVHKIDIVIVYSESNISFFIFAPQVPTRDKTKNITPHERIIVNAILSFFSLIK